MRLTDCGPPFAGLPVRTRPAARIVHLEVGMRRRGWLMIVAVMGAIASGLAAGILWLVVTRPDVAAAIAGAWTGVGR